MKTKEEILNEAAAKHNPSLLVISHDMNEMIMAAMDDWANQQSVKQDGWISPEDWLIKEGYPLTMPITRSTIADIIYRYIYQNKQQNSYEINSDGKGGF